MQPSSGDARPPTQHGTGVRGTRLGRMGGVEVILDRSWYMIAVLTVVLYGPVLWRLYPEAGWLNVLLGAVFALGLAGSVLAHELAHALVGRWMGWPVGRIVLTLMGGHTTFGVVRATAGSSAWVSLAGPVTNVVLALVGTGLLLGAPARDEGPGWALLELLVRRQGEVLPRSLIASQIWDMNFDSDTNVIDVAIRRLRAKIDDDFEPKLIHTVRGMGYMLDVSSGA